MKPDQASLGRYAIVAAAGAIAGGAIAFFIAPSTDEFSRLQVQRDSLAAEVATLKQQIGPLQVEVKSLQSQNTAMKAEADQLGQTLRATEKTNARASSALDEQQRSMSALEKHSQSIAAENETLKKTLVEMRGKMDKSGAEQQALAVKLGATSHELEAAKARASELNRSYAALLSEKTTLADRAKARVAELETTRKAFEEAQSEVARLTGARGIYTVQNGDSLSIIAAFFYRNGLRWKDIFDANSALISQPDLIYPKQVLIVPQ